MKTDNKYFKNENGLKDRGETPVEIAAEKWANILISQIEFSKNKNKDKNFYGKEKRIL